MKQSKVFASLEKSKGLFLEAIAYRSHPQTKAIK